MDELLRRVVGNRTAVVVATDRVDGDFHAKHVEPDLLQSRQSAITGSLWTMLDQVHGVQSHTVQNHATGVVAVGDVLVTSDPDTPIAIWAADCAPLVMFGSNGTTVVVHAGWKGLTAGVVDVGVAQLSARDESVGCAVLGPSIHACCYEFGEKDLGKVAAGIGVSASVIAGRTSDGFPALDMPAAVSAALACHEVVLDVVAECTGCDDQWFSHRVRREVERHAVIAWTEESTMDQDPK